jgi:hypothetical protein
MLGLLLPGQYYFITWTSSPSSPGLDCSWNALRVWLKRERPGACWCYCFTDEGHGVIHMILRLGPGERRLNVTRVRAHWDRLHGARQIRINAVKKGDEANLAAYIEKQAKIKKLGGEMAWQSSIIRWHWSKNWIPRGFTRKFGKFWATTQDLSLGERLKMLNDWINKEHIQNGT